MQRMAQRMEAIIRHTPFKERKQNRKPDQPDPSKVIVEVIQKGIDTTAVTASSRTDWFQIREGHN